MLVRTYFVEKKKEQEEGKEERGEEDGADEGDGVGAKEVTWRVGGMRLVLR